MSLLGLSVRRVEDPRLLAGQGHFVADISVPGMAHAAFARSSVPHARFRLDVTAARRLPGVVAVLTAADLAGVLKPIRADAALAGMRAYTHTALATDTARLVGDPLALVVADSRAIAEDACDLISVSYDPLPPVPDASTALQPDSTPLYPEMGSNVAYHDTVTYGNVKKAFAAADRVVTRTLAQHRQMAAPLETRGGVAVYESAARELTYYTAMHAPHVMRQVLAEQLGLPQHHVRVIVGDIGGSFGSKWGVTREDMAVCAAARLTGRPVRWIEDRAEHLAVGGHARDEQITLAVAVAADGTLLGLDAQLVVDTGAYPVTPMNPPFLLLATRLLLPGPYRVPAYRFETTTVLTNKGPYVAYRGPWAIETWSREVMLDIVAREIGLAPAEIRRRNMLAPQDQPYRTAAGYTLSGITAAATMERALKLAADPAPGSGFGMATFIEPAPGTAEFLGMMGGGRESARLRLEPTGEVTVYTSQVPHGQGHETTIGQVVASELTIPLDQVRVIHGDTASTPFSTVGTGGSRAATFATGAVRGAARELKAKVLALAGAILGTDPAALELTAGTVSGMSLGKLAGMAYLAPAFLPPGAPVDLEASASCDGTAGGFSQATHCCWVEIDQETGQVRITRYLVVEDCGTMINPAVVEGQIRGGTAQGIGGVLYEALAYDAHGQPLTRTPGEYLLPGAPDIPPIEIDHVPSGEGPRGVGEGGAIGAPPALTNAIADALGQEITRQSVTPELVLTLLGRV